MNKKIITVGIALLLMAIVVGTAAASEIKIAVSVNSGASSITLNQATDLLMAEARRLHPADIVLRVENVKNDRGGVGQFNGRWSGTAVIMLRNCPVN